MLQTVRTVSSELRPPVLDEFGLVAAIEWQAAEFQKKYGTRCTVTVDWRTEFRCQRVEIAVFRIIQEALTNVARHARASKVEVNLTEGVSELILTVRDNGRGITKVQQSQSLGILGMRERALLFGGAVAIVGVKAKGTTVTVTIPRRTIGGALAPRKETLL
jgi:signal transduction histidine kinase